MKHVYNIPPRLKGYFIGSHPTLFLSNLQYRLRCIIQHQLFLLLLLGLAHLYIVIQLRSSDLRTPKNHC